MFSLLGETVFPHLCLASSTTSQLCEPNTTLSNWCFVSQPPRSFPDEVQLSLLLWNSALSPTPVLLSVVYSEFSQFKCLSLISMTLICYFTDKSIEDLTEKFTWQGNVAFVELQRPLLVLLFFTGCWRLITFWLLSTSAHPPAASTTNVPLLMRMFNTPTVGTFQEQQIFSAWSEKKIQKMWPKTAHLFKWKGGFRGSTQSQKTTLILIQTASEDNGESH